MRGAKVLSLHAKAHKIRVIDSLNFLGMALRKMPKALGFQASAVKGHWPYLFNQLTNHGKVFDSLPPQSYFDPLGLKADEYEEFEIWFARNRRKRFDFDFELKVSIHSSIH